MHRYIVKPRWSGIANSAANVTEPHLVVVSEVWPCNSERILLIVLEEVIQFWKFESERHHQ